jgi:hypothetical protein
MITPQQILRAAQIPYEPYQDGDGYEIYLTAGHQLVGTHKMLGDFRSGSRHYQGWQSHHILETQDLDRLHITRLAPDRDHQFCVLLPERAHIGRINSILRRQAPIGAILPPRSLLGAYRDAYDLVGDYCGGGERMIRRELVAIVEASLRLYGVL